KNAATQAPVVLKSPTLNQDPSNGKNTLIAMTIIVLMLGAFGANKLFKSGPSTPAVAEKIEPTQTAPATVDRATSPFNSKPTSARPQSKLLSEGGGGTVRTAPPVSFNPSGGATRLEESPPARARDRRDLRSARENSRADRR